MKADAWKPRRRGATYCSPACGAGCTHEAYERARRHAKALLDGMRTCGWEADVWENLGWHYALRHRELEIGLHPTGEFENGLGSYFLSGLTSMVGNIPYMKDPNKLVDALMRHFHSEANRIEHALMKLRGKK